MRNGSSKTLVIGLLVHENYDRVVSLIDFFNNSNIAIVIHVDRSSSTLFQEISARYDDVSDVDIISNHYCQWGEWSLVEAELDIYKVIVNKYKDCKHIHFMSAADVPVKSIIQIQDYLSEHIDCDFVELVDIRRYRFMIDGPQIDRLVYRYPFNFLKHRWLFEAFMLFQKLFKLKRKLPDGLIPHMGGQFKTLKYSTVEILLDTISDRPKLARFFSKSWVPDESFLPTLIATLYAKGKLTGKVMPSLIYRVFDDEGKPIILTPNFLPNLYSSRFLFARKYQGTAEINFDDLNNLTTNHQPLRKPEIISGDLSDVFLIIWDSQFSAKNLELITDVTFCGALDTSYDNEHDKYINWDQIKLNENELEIWRAFRYDSPLCYIREIKKVHSNAVSLTLNIDSIKKYAWERVIKDTNFNLCIYPEILSDFRFEKVRLLRK